MQYHVARDGQQLGEIPEEQLREGLFSGAYLSTDMAWREGMGEWTPLGQLFGAPRAAVPRRPVVAYDTSISLGKPPAPGLAVAALIVGIISLVTCSLFGVGALVTIIMGHIALSRINRSGGALGGRGMAMAGLIMGYVSLAVGAIAIAASLAVPVFSRVQEKAEITKAMSNARQITVACRLYASDNDGKFPDSLETLVEKHILAPEELAKLDGSKPRTWQGETGFDYLGQGKTDNMAPEPVLISKAADRKGQRIVSRVDGSTALEQPPSDNP